MYQKPQLERFGTLRTLTEYGFGFGSDPIGILANIATGGDAGGASDGCNPSGNILTGCVARHS